MKIKMVIWDLDNTLWKGIIAERPVKMYEGRAALIKKLNRRGIVNAVCSHNDSDLPEAKLTDLGLKDELVFRRYTWSGKGQEILDMMEKAQLRSENILFIDDRRSNLEEAKYYLEDINAVDPHQKDFLSIMDDVLASGKDDSDLSRLKQYKILEEKAAEQGKYKELDEFAFLHDSEICISITRSVARDADRVHELLSRTNQLNYTKNRPSKKEVLDIIANYDYNTYTIIAQDKFGFYGVIGFIAYGDDVKHFAFSCRVLNMGIESFVFYEHSLPDFKYVGDVSYDIYNYKPKWVNHLKERLINTAQVKPKGKCLVVGGCDLEQTVSYINMNSDRHFNYVSPKNRRVIVHRDSIDLLLSDTLSKKDIEYITATCPFIDRKAFNLPKFEEYDAVVYSPLIDYIQGKYTSDRVKDFYLSCNPFLKEPLTKELKNKIMRTKGLSDKAVRVFASNWTYVEKPLDEYEQQLIKLFSKCKKLIVLLAATNTYSSLDADKIEKHKQYNELVVKVADSFGIRVIDVDKYITSRGDFTNAIRHYKRHIYSKIAVEINDFLGE